MTSTAHADGQQARPTGVAGGSAAGSAAQDSATMGRRLDGLIGMLSHDLRTPLSAISGWLFLLESGKLDQEGQKRALAKIKISVEEQVQLIDDTLLISRGQAGRLEIETAPLLLAEPLAEAIDAVRPQAEAKSVAIDTGAGLPKAPVEGDAKLLRRAFELLLAHALKVTPAGGGIFVSSSAGPGRIEVGIRDTGVGFAAAELPFVLDPFRPLPEDAKSAPRGPERGLLLAQAILAAHQGSLSLASGGAGQGESFTIALPAANNSNTGRAGGP
jgi:signal transduction histidine kinase